MDGPPPPPPPHGENPNTTHGFKRDSGLPEGNYDIFIIPPHSSGSGFLYLPSLQTHRNSFLAGAASALVVVYTWQTLSPIVKAWYLATAANGGGMGVAVLLAVVGIAGWGFGAYQAHVAGSNRESGGSSQSRQSGPGSPGGPGGTSYHQSSGAGPGPGPGYSTGPNFGGPNPGQQGTYGGGNYGAGPGPGGPYPGNQYGAGAAPHTPPPNADPGPEKAEQSESKSKSGEDWERAREETRRKEELKRKMEEFKRKREAEAREKQKQREREAMDRELRERKEQLEKEMAAAKEKAEREARERAEKEAAEARAKIERELAEAKAKAEREAAEAKAERLAALAKEKAAKEAAEKEAAAKAAAKREADAKFAALKEAAAKKYAEKKAKDAQEAAGKGDATPKAASNASTAPRTPSPKKPTPADQDDAYSFRPYDRPRRPYGGTSGSPSVYSESSYAPSQSTARTTPPPSTRGAYSTKDPDKIVIRGVYAFNNAFMRSPVAQLVSGQGMVTDGLVLRITTEGLFIDDDIRGVPQREWDVKAWTMKLVEVWCPQHGATAQGRPNPKPANVFFRRSTNEPTPEESDANLVNFLKVCKNKCRLASPDEEEGGLHVVRASIRDQEGRRYVFVLQETEGWKVAVGLQRLRKGALARGLGVIGMTGKECRTLLGDLGYA